MDLLNITIDEFITNSSGLLEELKQDALWQKIPMVNNIADLSRLKDGQLVRFRGIVQDMLDPEIYLEQFEIKRDDNSTRIKCGKYRDNTNLAADEMLMFDSNANEHKERRAMFMVSVPGLNEWAVDVEKRFNGVASTLAEVTSVSNGKKRSLSQNNEAMDTDEKSQIPPKKLSSDDAKNEGSESKGLSREYLLNSPIIDRPSKACMVKFYENYSNIALNSVYDTVGFLSIDPSLCGSTRNDNEFESFEEVCAMNPPPSLIPRMHVISSRLMNNLNPLLDGIETLLGTEQLKEAYNDLKNVLTQCLFGDTLAAEYLICHLISTVYVRGDTTLGQFSLNITNIPSEVLPAYTKQLYEIIESLLPASHYLPITLENLNTTEFIPAKDYATGKLTSGLLQLAPHTHLILDETCLQPGKLDNHGIESVINISHLIRTQKLKINFKFYNIEYDANLPVLVLSEGKSMFASDCHLPLKPDPDCIRLISETMSAGKHFLRPKLDTLRRYLTLMRLQEFDMKPENMEMIQEDFVTMRRDFNATADDLHSLLILTRMLGILRGKPALDADAWNEAKQFESERRERIKTK